MKAGFRASGWLLLAACWLGGAATAHAADPAPPSQVTPLAPPLQVKLSYAPAPPRQRVLTREWGPLAALSGGAPPLQRRVEASVRAETVPLGVHLIVERGPTVLTRAEASQAGDDAGILRAAVAPDGRLFEIEAKLEDHGDLTLQLRRDHLLGQLIHRGRPAPFRRLLDPAGPGDIVGRMREREERAARAEALIELAPLLALVPGMPPAAVADGDAVTLMRRDFGTLFRRHPDLWTETSGRVAGLAMHRGRRVIVVVADAEPALGPGPGWQLTTRGHGLLDIDSGFYLQIVLDHVLTAPGDESEGTRFVVRERLTLE